MTHHSGNTPTATLVSSEHGFDDYDVEGIPTVHRVTVGHGIRKGDLFNVYCEESRKIGAVWHGTLQKSLEHLADRLASEVLESKPSEEDAACANQRERHVANGMIPMTEVSLEEGKFPEGAQLVVECLQTGDKVDLRSCPFLKEHASAEFEYAVVESVERETTECVAVSYVDHGVVGYPVGFTLTVSAETIGSRNLQRKRPAPSGGHCEDCKWSARSGYGKCDGCLALDEAAEVHSQLVFEVTASGFDARDDKTDDRVFWVQAVSEESVTEGIRGTGAVLRGVVDCNSDVDFRLPDDLESMRDRLLAIRLEMREAGCASVNWKGIAEELYGAVDSLETQVTQMMGMFPDDDGMIQKALDEAAEASSAYKAANQAERVLAGKLPASTLQDRDIELCILGAQTHGECEEPDHEVGDLQDCVREMWRLMTRAQQQTFMASDAVRDRLEYNLPEEIFATVYPKESELEGELTKVRKTVIQYTVLHDDGQDLSSISLREIAYECDEGGYVGGGLAVVTNEALTRQQVDAEAAKVGSDASFFDIDPEAARLD